MADNASAVRETSSQAAPLASQSHARPEEVVLPVGPDAHIGTLRVAVVDCISFTRECIAATIRGLSRRHPSHAGHVEVEEFASYDDAPATSRFEVVLYHLHGAPGEIPVELSKIAGLARLIVLGADGSPEAVRAAFDCGARGYIPTATAGLELLMQIIHFVNAGGIFVPPIVLTPTAIPTDRQRLTRRELLILDLLKKGKQNKVIAYELGMSESTTKVHIRSILTKLHAKNRTEAVSASLQPEASNAMKS